MSQASKSASRLRAVESRHKPIHRLFFKKNMNKGFPFTSWKLELEQVISITCQMTGNWHPTNSGAAPAVGEFSAGFTYLGQMVTHDIVQNTNDIDSRYVSPYLNLDSIYPEWEDRDRALFVKDDGTFRLIEIETRIGENCTKTTLDYMRHNQDDRQIAHIREPRNDENIILSALVVYWMRLHNKIISSLLDCGLDERQRYEAVRDFVIVTFQKHVIDELLAGVLTNSVFDHYFNNDNELEKKELFFLTDNDVLKSEFQIPIEFSHAAFRFGHSMVRQTYTLNKEDVGVAVSKIFQRHSRPNTYVDLTFFFDGASDKSKTNTASLISLDFAGGLTQLKNTLASRQFSLAAETARRETLSDSRLCVRSYELASEKVTLGVQENVMNLVGIDLEASEVLPTGGDIFRAISNDSYIEAQLFEKFGIDKSCYEKKIDLRKKFRDIRFPCLECGAEDSVGLNLSNTPFWLFVLKEATETFPMNKKSEGLGPIASLIVAEVMYRSIMGSHTSVFSTCSSSVDEQNPLSEEYKAVLNNKCTAKFLHDNFESLF